MLLRKGGLGMEIYLVKSSGNGIRASIKSFIQTNEPILKGLKDNLSFINSKSFSFRYRLNPALTIREVSQNNKLDLPSDASFSDLQDSMRERIDYIEKIDMKANSLLAGFSNRGFVKPTFGLPALFLLWESSDMAFPFLLASGIKVNASKKDPDDPRMDEVEAELLAYEKQMAVYINDNFTIDKENMLPFMNLFEKYLETYCNKEKYYSEFLFCRQYYKYNLVTMALYIAFCDAPIYLSKEEYANFSNLYESYKRSGVVSNAEALCLMSEYAIYEYRKVQQRILEGETQEKPQNPIDEYVKDNRVIASCDLETFSSMLQATKLSESIKSKLLCEMEDLLAYEKREAKKRKLEDLRKKLMSANELELYNLARCYVELANVVSNIDAAIEMYDENLSDENKNLLLEELEYNLSILSRTFSSVTGTLDKSDSVVYYNCTIEDKTGVDVRIPCILKSILANKLLSKVVVDAIIREIIAGNTARDHRVKGKDLPCEIYCKGREVRVFYTKIKDTTVIIDLGYEEEGYDRLIDLVQSEQFITFLRTLETYIADGNRPNAVNYTDLIKTSLNRSNKIMKLI